MPTPEELEKAAVVARKFLVDRGTNDMAKFRGVVSASYDGWLRERRVPSIEELALATGHQRAVVARILDSEGYRAACEERGIQLGTAHGLTAQQSLALAIVTDPTRRAGLGAKLKQAGVTYVQWRGWQKQALFVKALNAMAESTLSENTPEVLTQLTAKAVGGDMRAIQLHLEVTGRHDPRAKESVDPAAFVGQLIEIISRRITNQSTLNLIAGDLDYLLKNGTVGPMAIGANAAEPNELTIVTEPAVKDQPAPRPVGNYEAPSLDFLEDM